MQFEIGEMAGKVWRLLDSKGALSLTEIKSEFLSQDFLVISAIGWLARENKISIAAKGKSFIISLN
jgi:hypothetical protein